MASSWIIIVGIFILWVILGFPGNLWIIVIFIIGVILAFPLAILISAGLGWLIQLIGIRCPSCRKRKLKCYSLIRPTRQPSRSFYRCENCGARYKCLNGRPWENASSPEYDKYYESGSLYKKRGR